MSERATLYTVTVRPRSRGAAPLPLADLADVLAGALDGFSATSADGGTVARVLSTARDGDDLFAIVEHGSRGIAADIVDASGAVRLRQTPDDLQLIRSGCLFRLPAGQTAGALAVHVSNGRGVKELFEQELVSRFRTARPGLLLRLDRLAEPDALRQAVAENRIEKLRLVRLEAAGKRTFGDTDRWVAAGKPARIQLEIGAHGRDGRISGALLERYLGGDGSALADIVAFGGLAFDSASVGVLLPDGTRRLFDLAHPEAGRPLTRALEGIVLDGAGEPTAESLLAALRGALGS